MKAALLLILCLQLFELVMDGVLMMPMLAQSCYQLASQVVQLVYLARQHLTIHLVGLQLQSFPALSLRLHPFQIL